MATRESIIAEEWRSRAAELAEWAMQRLVNRTDVWGQYSVLTPTEQRDTNRTYKAMTLPAVSQRANDDDDAPGGGSSKQLVTLNKLTRHFASRRGRKPQLIGLHAKSKETTSRWFGIDIDNHAEDADSADDLARRNLNAAVDWHRALQTKGYDPLLLDTNGAGGYHLWVLFAEPAPTEDVYAMSLATIADWQARELERLPETFPKRVKDDSLGSWFRLPGLHHTRDHHVRVWAGDWAIDAGLDDPWLSGHAAIDAMLGIIPGPPPPVADPAMLDRAALSRPARSRETNDARPGDSAPAPAARSFERTGRATVCVDLDGVLATRLDDGSAIGPPVDGAIEFTRVLHATTDIVIYTARFGTTTGKARSVNEVDALRTRIERWLDDHGFAWDRIHTDGAKPIASAYVDDRAVPCRPLVDGPAAFDQALAGVRQLTL